MSVSLLTRLTLSKEAKTLFNSGTQVYVRFKAKYYWETDDTYHRFNNAFDFETNLSYIKEEYQNKEGFFHYFTDNMKYAPILPPQPSHTQLSLF